jgi:hypothetical protein
MFWFIQKLMELKAGSCYLYVLCHRRVAMTRLCVARSRCGRFSLADIFIYLPYDSLRYSCAALMRTYMNTYLGVDGSLTMP